MKFRISLNKNRSNQRPKKDTCKCHNHKTHTYSDDGND